MGTNHPCAKVPAAHPTEAAAVAHVAAMGSSPLPRVAHRRLLDNEVRKLTVALAYIVLDRKR